MYEMDSALVWHAYYICVIEIYKEFAAFLCLITHQEKLDGEYGI